MTIDKIEYAGNTYEFADGTARKNIATVATSIDGFEDLVNKERSRAISEENSIRNDMASSSQIEEIQRTVDELVEHMPDISEMIGATDTLDGKGGTVPKPLKANKDMYLKGDGTWSDPPGRDIPLVTTTEEGLMSAADKQKLDGLADDDYVASTTTFEGNVITQTFGNGKKVTTTFNSNGTISQSVRLREGGLTKDFTITFNGDGSIVRSEANG